VVACAVQQEKCVRSKSTPTDLVTEADQQVEDLIISTLRSRYPEHRCTFGDSIHTHTHTHIPGNRTWNIFLISL